MFAGNAQRAAVIRQAQVATVEAVWVLGAGGLNRLARSGAHVDADEVLKRRRAVTPAMPATIVYTSGTTGRPKGCVLSHGNLISAVRAITSAPGISNRVLTGDASILFFLPLSHILARVVALCVIHAGQRIGYLADLGRLPSALAAFRPDGPARSAARVRKARRHGAGAGRGSRPPETVRCGRGHGHHLEQEGARCARWSGYGTRYSAAWFMRGCVRLWGARWPGQSAAEPR